MNKLRESRDNASSNKWKRVDTFLTGTLPASRSRTTHLRIVIDQLIAQLVEKNATNHIHSLYYKSSEAMEYTKRLKKSFDTTDDVDLLRSTNELVESLTMMISSLEAHLLRAPHNTARPK